MKTITTKTLSTPAILDPGLETGLKRLKLSTIRRIAPDMLLTAKTQRWAPEETLRTLIEAEVDARDKSNTIMRMTAAKFPVKKTLEEFNINESSIPPASHDYLTTLDWIHQTTNLCLIGPAGTGKSHYLIALGRAAVTAGYKVRYFTAIDLVEHLYRATADNTVGKTIEQLCRNDLLIVDEIGFAPLDHTGCQLLFRLISAVYERRSIAIGSHSPFETWGRFLPDQPTAVSLLDRLCHHAHIITQPATPTASNTAQEAKTRTPQPQTRTTQREDFHVATTEDNILALDSVPA